MSVVYIHTNTVKPTVTIMNGIRISICKAYYTKSVSKLLLKSFKQKGLVTSLIIGFYSLVVILIKEKEIKNK